MSVFKCKMCGGSLEIGENESVATCEYCGTQQTLPKLDDERKANLYDRANHFRRNNEFDKAMGIYEQILNEDKSDAEAYWSLVLCRYGIEYVEDPATHKRVPTVNRAQFTSIFDDDNYKSALAYAADTLQRSVYESEAKAINEIQKGILAISQKEEPFDVFICYKETDANGRRTPDSVLANDLYHQLTQEGFKVFFARITLEDKLGTAYEPYIFAALNSAKVMVVLGTKPEHFNAVWVKNEWSRYLALVKTSCGKKILIPAYKDMDPYDLPEEFSHLQAQDMSKLGFMQDLIRGIKKITGADEPKAGREAVVSQGAGNTTVDAQLKRGNIALEDHDWEKADSFFEEALNLAPECAEAYIGKMLAREKKPGLASWVAVQKEANSAAATERLVACQTDLDHIAENARKFEVPDYLWHNAIDPLYDFDRSYDSALSCRKRQKETQQAELASDRLLTRAKQYARGETKQQLDDALAEITATLDGRIAAAEKADAEKVSRIKAAYADHLAQADKEAEKLNADAQARREDDYQAAVAAMQRAEDIPAYETAIAKLEAMHGFKDCPKRVESCKTAINDIIYKDADALYNAGKFEDAISVFEKLNGFKDSKEFVEKCRAELDRQKAGAERLAADKKKKKRIIVIVAAVAVCLAVAFLIVLTSVIIPNGKYNDAADLYNAGKYDEAISAFEALDGYKDSADRAVEAKYAKALALSDAEDYDSAIELFTALGDYRDSADQIEKCTQGINENKYNEAMALIEEENYVAAYKLLNEIGDQEAINSSKYSRAMEDLDSGNLDTALALLKDINYKDSEQIVAELRPKVEPYAVLNEYLSDHSETIANGSTAADYIDYGISKTAFVSDAVSQRYYIGGQSGENTIYVVLEYSDSICMVCRLRDNKLMFSVYVSAGSPYRAYTEINTSEYHSGYTVQASDINMSMFNQFSLEDKEVFSDLINSDGPIMISWVSDFLKDIKSEITLFDLGLVKFTK